MRRALRGLPILRNRRGSTLTELIVSMALTAILGLTVIALVHPVAELMLRTRQRTYAQYLADALLDALRQELLSADDTLCFADASEPFAAAEAADAGDALAWRQSDGIVKLLEAGAAEPTAEAGCLRIHSWAAGTLLSGATLNDPFRTPCPPESYLGLKIGTLQFAARGLQTEPDGELDAETHLTSLEVTLTIIDAAGNTLCTGQAILPLPGTPRLADGPLLPDGSESSGIAAASLSP